MTNAGAVDYGEPQLVILDARDLTNSIPQGFMIDSCYNSTVVICASSKLNDLVDNVRVWGLDLSLIDGLSFERIKIAYAQSADLNKEFKLRYYLGAPTSLYQSLINLNTDHFVEDLELPVFTAALAAMIDPELIKSYWLNLHKSQAMQLFSGRVSFLTYCSKSADRGACRGLAPLLQPFVQKFKQTYEVRYLHAFGRWLYYSNTVWASRHQQGVCKYKLGYFCNFSELALIHWQQIVTDIENL